jgi:hypothetical protein
MAPGVRQRISSEIETFSLDFISFGFQPKLPSSLCDSNDSLAENGDKNPVHKENR